MDFNIIFFLIFIFASYVCGEEEVKFDTKSIIRSTLALNVLSSTVKSTTNMVVATLPLELLFCKIGSVAKGKAKKELNKAMGFTNDTWVNYYYTYFQNALSMLQFGDLTYVNRIYVDYSKDMNMKFAKDSVGLYGVHVDTVSYNMPKAALDFVNKGISSVTYRRVEDVLKAGDIYNLTSLLLITAGHFKPTWAESFDPTLTTIGPFQLPNNTRVDMPMMTMVQEYQFYDAKDFRVITIPLTNPWTRITFVQPDFVSLERVFQKLSVTPALLRSIRKRMTWTFLKFVMPRIKVKSQVYLDDFLQKVGIKEIFNNKSTDLNAILKEGVKANNISVSKVTQKLFIEMDEFGISRVYEPLLARKPFKYLPTRTPEVTLDRPFYFIVHLEPSEDDVYELFHGVYYGPQ